MEWFLYQEIYCDVKGRCSAFTADKNKTYEGIELSAFSILNPLTARSIPGFRSLV